MGEGGEISRVGRRVHSDRQGRRRAPRRPAAGVPLCLVCALLAVQGCAATARVATQEYVRVRSAISASTVSITLERSFVETYKDRVTIDVPFTVDKSDRLPHPAFMDGDFHIAGRAPGIGLPVVAEIKNAASEKDALAAVRGEAGTGRSIRLAGGWRLWAEHAGRAEEVQGGELSPIEATNPDHVFEIHPVTRVGGLDLLASLHPPEGYKPPKADFAFGSFGRITCRIVPEDGTITIVTPKGQVNDAEFLMEIAEDGQRVVEDGRFVNAAVLDLNGKLLVRKARMVFVKGSPPERIVRGLGRGRRLHVFGLPRIDLSAVAWRVRHAAKNPELLERNLPYEIVVAGVYGDASPRAARGGRQSLP